MLKGSVAAWLKSVVVCEDEDFDEVSDWTASSADAAAPRAKNMTELQPTPRDAAHAFATPGSANAVPSQKTQQNIGFVQSEPSACPGN
jgi:hypothetical protein